MIEVTVTLTNAQVKAVRRLDGLQTLTRVLQTHIDTWLAPCVQDMDTEDRTSVVEAYRAADPALREQVKGLLGLG